ncbi:prolyl oligopeptidase family serine peptidase [Caulobacter segnis]|uniref:S9 family peptidase n=1 Tax=Caulobacter segnis TaxID=88688 RepID=UPI0028679527|nr:prolyl oligopeptidase family serine peptidase [Caulobacter segnis]MDR6624480.1 dipeptidyl aminopeptidase/acylaminoacyl peptidase [Caulobacter segnis]
MTFKPMLLGRLTAAWLVMAAPAGAAETLTLDRLLKIEEFGAAALSPDGRHLVVETRAPFDTAAAFDTDNPAPRLGRLMVADLSTPTPARPLLAAETGAGYTAGPFSPDGHRMIISRWKAYRYEAGVVDLRSGDIRWMGFGLEQANYGRSLQWLSNTAFVTLARDPADPTLKLKLGWQNQKRLGVLWARQAAGKVSSVQAIGSGRARRPEPMDDRRLMRVDLATGAQTELARGGFFDMELSPSGRYVALLEEAERVGLAATPAVRMMAPFRRRALSIVDLRTGAVTRPCPRCTTLIEPMVWAPGADRLLVFQHPADQLEAAGHLAVIDAAGGGVQTVGADLEFSFDYGGEGAARVRADWLGGHPIALAKAAGATRSDWYDIEGKDAVNLTKALPSAPGSVVLGGGKTLLALVDGQAWRIGADGAATRLSAGGSGWARPSAFGVGLRPRSAPWRTDQPILRTPTGLANLFGHSSALPSEATPIATVGEMTVCVDMPESGARSIALLDGMGRRRDLVTLDGDLARLDLGSVRTVASRAANGQMLKSWLYLPPRWRPGDKPALIVVPYPGSAPQTSPARFYLSTDALTPNPALLAAQGYAVLLPALPRDRDRGEPGENLAAEILSVVDAVVAEGLADPDRLALWGHSFGGYAALVTATQTQRFKAIIAQAAPSEFISNWGTVDPHFVTAPEDGAPNPMGLAFNETGQGALLGPPWAQTERYVRNSPLLQADKVMTPLMLIYGDQDFVGLNQGQGMFMALYRQDKDATLLTLFGERHLPMSPANVRAIYGEVLPWLADRLGSPPRAPEAKAEAARPSQ